MEVSKNNLIFKSNIPPVRNLNDISSMSDREIDITAKRAAYEDNKDRFKHTNTLRKALLIGIPTAGIILNVAKKNGESLDMAARVKNGAKTAGYYGVLLTIAGVFFGTVHHFIKKSPDIHQQAKDHNISYGATSLLGAIIVVPRAANYLCEKAGSLAGWVRQKVDPNKEMLNSVTKVTNEHINKLKDGHIEGALNSIDNFLKKENVVAGKNGEFIAGAAIGVSVLGYLAKSFHDVHKFNKDVKENKETLRDLRSSSKEIETLKNELDTTIILADLEEKEAMNVIPNLNRADSRSASQAETTSNTIKLSNPTDIDKEPSDIEPETAEEEPESSEIDNDNTLSAAAELDEEETYVHETADNDTEEISSETDNKKEPEDIDE